MTTTTKIVCLSAASPRSWAHTLALDHISGNFVVCLTICTVRKCLIPKRMIYIIFILLSLCKKNTQCRYHSNLTRPASSYKRPTQENAQWMHRDTLCSFGPCPNCAQIMNVKRKGNRWTFVEDFLHFAV